MYDIDDERRSAAATFHTNVRRDIQTYIYRIIIRGDSALVEASRNYFCHRRCPSAPSMPHITGACELAVEGRHDLSLHDGNQYYILACWPFRMALYSVASIGPLAVRSQKWKHDVGPDPVRH